MDADAILKACPNTRCVPVERGSIFVRDYGQRPRRVTHSAGKFVLFEPSKMGRTVDGRVPVFLGFDSLSVTGERHGLPYINRCAEMCAKYGAFGAFPFPPVAEMRGLWRGWAVPGGALRRKEGPNGRDDTYFVAKVVEELEELIVSKGVGEAPKFCAAGFSDAGHFVQVIDTRLPGMFHDVVSVNGTIDCTLPLPGRTSRLIVIHGADNHVLPVDGGVGSSLASRLKCWVASGGKAQNSNPRAQLMRYAEVHGDAGQLLDVDGVRIMRYPAAGVQFIVDGCGHEWAGRRRGKPDGTNAESLWSPSNAGPGTSFSVNETIARECGWQAVD